MATKLTFIAEQEIVIWRSASDQQRVTIRVSVPQIEKHPYGYDAWACYPRVDGLIAINKPAYGYSSFQALVTALQGCRQLIRDASKGAKIYAVGDLRGSSLDPDHIVPLKDLFALA